MHVIPVDKIDYIQAQDDYVCFRSEGKDYLKEQTLAEAEASLDPSKFVRNPPLVSAQPGPSGAGQSGRARESRGGAHRRPPSAGEPRRLHTAQLAALDQSSGRSCHGAGVCCAVNARRGR